MRTSPAQAAAISRKLADAGIEKAVEIRKGWETAGYAVEMYPDHIRVEWVPGLIDTPEDGEKIADGLDRCAEVLCLAGYEVKRAVGRIATPGAWEEGPVLEVRK